MVVLAVDVYLRSPTSQGGWWAAAPDSGNPQSQRQSHYFWE